MNFSQNTKVLALLMLIGVVTCRYVWRPEGSQNGIKKLVEANNNFGLNLYQKMRENSDENLFFSPLSLSMAFGMLFHGARRDTAKELRSALGYKKAGLIDDELRNAFSSYMQHLQSSQGYELSLANGILVDKSLPLTKSYVKIVKSVYQAPVESVNFAAQSEKIKNSVNNWVNLQTNGKIDSLLEDLSQDTLMIILNAVFFKGTWKVPFDPELTMDSPFYNDGQNAKDVPTMHMSETTFPYASFPTYSAVELPYDGNVSMVILLPEETNGLASLDASFSADLLSSTLSTLHPTPVTVSLPKFNLETSETLNAPLQGLGMQGVFSNGANLSGISRAQGLKVSEVVHKATLTVDEKGSVAAAATAIGVVPYSAQLDRTYFNVDHPFVFAIVDRKSDLVMFVGRVNKL